MSDTEKNLACSSCGLTIEESQHLARRAAAAVEADRAQQGEPVGEVIEGYSGDSRAVRLYRGHTFNTGDKLYRAAASTQQGEPVCAPNCFWGDCPPCVDARAATSAAAPDAPEPLAWESTTPVYTRFITDSRYQKLRPAYQKWYRPICQKCGAAPATGIPAAGAVTCKNCFDTGMERGVYERRPCGFCAAPHPPEAKEGGLTNE